MCGRFGFDIPRPVLEEQFSITVADDIPPSFNIAPGQPVLGVTLYEGARQLMGFVWGFTPPWSTNTGRGHINARSETAFEKASFKGSMAHHRCLVPASFYYEWKLAGNQRVPYAIMLASEAPFGIGAIYIEHDRFGPSLALLTCAANETTKPIHDRMPVIIAPKDHAAWLAPHAGRDEIEPLMTPYAGTMTFRPVSPRVNSPANNDRELLKSVPAQGQLPF